MSGRLRALRRRITYSDVVTGAIALVAYAVMWLWFKTLRIEYVYHPDFDREQRNHVAYGFWHGRQLLLMFCFGWVHPAILTDVSWLGKITGKLIQHFGHVPVHGSSKRQGVAALLALKQAVADGHSVAFALDGPRGPIYQAKPGIVFLAHKLQLPIVPLLSSCQNAWVLDKTWDRFELPKPFSRCWVGVGQPFVPEKFDRREAVAECTRRVNAWLAELDQRAGRSPSSSERPIA